MTYSLVKFGDVVRFNTNRIADPLAAGIERYVGLEHDTVLDWFGGLENYVDLHKQWVTEGQNKRDDVD